MLIPIMLISSFQVSLADTLDEPVDNLDRVDLATGCSGDVAVNIVVNSCFCLET